MKKPLYILYRKSRGGEWVRVTSSLRLADVKAVRDERHANDCTRVVIEQQTVIEERSPVDQREAVTA